MASLVINVLRGAGSDIMVNTSIAGFIFAFKLIGGVFPTIVKLRSRSRSGEGQVRVRKVKETKDLDLRYTIFLVFTHPPPSTAHKLFSWILRGLDKSDGPRMGWYDFSMVREG